MKTSRSKTPHKPNSKLRGVPRSETPHKPDSNLRGVPRSETPHKPDSNLRGVPRSETSQKGFFTSHPSSDKEKRNLTILELIRTKGPISRTELSKLTNINIVSISNYIKDYIGKNLVSEKGFDVSSGGRRRELVEFNERGCYVVGVDLDELRIIATLTDLAGGVVKKVKGSRPEGNIEELANKAMESIQGLIKDAAIKVNDIKAIGLGASDDNFIAARSIIEKRLGISAFFASDASCAAFGEKRLNPQADVETLLYIYSDLGCGIVVSHDSYFGAGGSSDEMDGSQYLRPWGSDLEMAQIAKKEIRKGIGTKIVEIAKGDIDNVTKDVVIEAAQDKDDLALDIIEMAGMNLGIRIAYLVNLFTPGVVVIGGGIEKAGELILDPIRKTVEKHSFTKQADFVKIIPSALGEDAVSLGAASLAIREVFLRA